MLIHQKNIGVDKNKTADYQSAEPSTHQALPIVEQKGIIDGDRSKKKESLWVEKNPKKNDRMVDQ